MKTFAPFYFFAGIAFAVLLVFFLSSVNFTDTKAQEDLLKPNETSPSAVPADVENPACADNYRSWENSFSRDESLSWTNNFMMSGSHLGPPALNTLQDINGDSLPDYIYMRKGGNSLPNGSTCQSDRTQEQVCIYLNNGSGWDETYRCVTSCENNNGVYQVKYWGDCASV